MITQTKMIEITRLAAELSRRHQEIERHHAKAIQNAFDALKSWDRTRAQCRFNFALEWNQLHETASCWLRDLTNDNAPTFVCDSWFLRSVIRHLTPGEDEEITHVTGPQYGPVRILSRLCPLHTDKKSPVYAKGTAKSCADAEIEILEHGNSLHAMAHSHPGRGPSATCPSGIDINYLGRIQSIGSEAIGVIITRDGFVRFFTVTKPFRVLVTGTGITQLEEYVYQVSLHSSNR